MTSFKQSQTTQNALKPSRMVTILNLSKTMWFIMIKGSDLLTQIFHCCFDFQTFGYMHHQNLYFQTSQAAYRIQKYDEQLKSYGSPKFSLKMCLNRHICIGTPVPRPIKVPECLDHGTQVPLDSQEVKIGMEATALMSESSSFFAKVNSRLIRTKT